MWKNYRKKPIVIRAIRYDGVNVGEIRTFTRGKAKIENKVGSSQDGEGYPQRYIQEQEGKEIFEYSVFGSPQQKIGDFTQTKLGGFNA
jgi:hypothetical protein